METKENKPSFGSNSNACLKLSTAASMSLSAMCAWKSNLKAKEFTDANGKQEDIIGIKCFGKKYIFSSTASWEFEISSLISNGNRFS